MRKTSDEREKKEKKIVDCRDRKKALYNKMYQLTQNCQKEIRFYIHSHGG